jgi:D-alanyl-D-alanine carboxypeptidase (penicillin-binding protein 5/6)
LRRRTALGLLIATAGLVLPPALPDTAARAQTAPATQTPAAQAPAAQAQGAPTAAAGPPVTAPPAPAAAAILIDVDTGRVLYAANAHAPLPPGSLTKVLTAMIAYDWLPASSQIPVNAVAYNAYPDKVGMKPGQKWPLAIALHALITDSANDAAYALAIDIGGSLKGFVPIMAEAGRQIGMTDHPTIEDPAGLDGTEGWDGGNRISAWDLAVAGRDMMANPYLAAIADQQTFDFEGPDHIAYHLLSRNYHFLASYPGAIGVKTGFTDLAGYCDMEEAQKGSRKMLAVVLKSTNPDQDAAALITQGFDVPTLNEAQDPRLPEVAQPEPPRKAPPPTVAPSNKVQPVVADVTPKPARTYGWEEGAAAAGVAVGTVLWLRRVANRISTRRRRPGDGKNQR